jgi:two-component system, chemotaxis family, chemotaxis protein CheY
LKVLIVDDSLNIQLILKEFFTKRLGLSVVGLCSNGDEAVDQYKKHRPQLVTLDIVMPQNGGIYAMEKLKELDPNAFVIVISSVEDMSIINKAISLGAKGYIRKQTQLDDSDTADAFIEDMKEIFKKNGIEHSI